MISHEFKKINKIKGIEFTDRMNQIVDAYNNRRRDDVIANEVLDDVADQLAQLLESLKEERDSFKGMGIDFEEKAFYDILKSVADKYQFEYPEDKMIELSKRIKIIVDDKAAYTDWATRDDIKATPVLLACISESFAIRSATGIGRNAFGALQYINVHCLRFGVNLAFFDVPWLRYTE